MQLFLREESFKCNLEGLNRRGYSSCLFVQIGNRRGYLVSKNNIDLLELLRSRGFMVSLYEKTKVPVYKQAMDFQMGKTPKTHKESLRNYRVTVIEGQFPQYAYTVWYIQG